MDRWNWCKYSIHSWNSQITFFQHHFIVLKFHIFHLNHTHFPVFPCPPLTLMTSSLEKKEERRKKKGKEFQVHFVLSIHLLEHGQSPSDQPLENWVLPSSLQEAINCEVLHFNIPITILKSSHQWLPV